MLSPDAIVPPRFAANAVRLQLHALATTLANFLRALALPDEVKQWSPMTLRDRLVKIVVNIVRHHGWSVMFQMAEAWSAYIVRRDTDADIPAPGAAQADMSAAHRTSALTHDWKLRRFGAPEVDEGGRPGRRRARDSPLDERREMVPHQRFGEKEHVHNNRFAKQTSRIDRCIQVCGGKRYFLYAMWSLAVGLAGNGSDDFFGSTIHWSR